MWWFFNHVSKMHCISKYNIAVELVFVQYFVPIVLEARLRRWFSKKLTKIILFNSINLPLNDKTHFTPTSTFFRLIFLTHILIFIVDLLPYTLIKLFRKFLLFFRCFNNLWHSLNFSKKLNSTLNLIKTIHHSKNDIFSSLKLELNRLWES